MAIKVTQNHWIGSFNLLIYLDRKPQSLYVQLGLFNQRANCQLTVLIFPDQNKVQFSPYFAIDEKIVLSCYHGLCWIPFSAQPDEWLEVDLQKYHMVKTVDFEYRHDSADQSRFKDIEVYRIFEKTPLNIVLFYIYVCGFVNDGGPTVTTRLP